MPTFYDSRTPKGMTTGGKLKLGGKQAARAEKALGLAAGQTLKSDPASLGMTQGELDLGAAQAARAGGAEGEAAYRAQAAGVNAQLQAQKAAQALSMMQRATGLEAQQRALNKQTAGAALRAAAKPLSMIPGAGPWLGAAASAGGSVVDPKYTKSGQFVAGEDFDIYDKK